MRRWLKIAVPMGIAAVLVTVLAIGFGSPRSDAAQCIDDGPGSTVMGGRAGSTVSYQFDFCSDPTLMMGVGVQWDRANKDLALRVTEPNGTQHLVDSTVGTHEQYVQGAPLPEGTWTVEVINMSRGKVDFALTIAFAADVVVQ